jgi:hypothetical protein
MATEPVVRRREQDGGPRLRTRCESSDGRPQSSSRGPLGSRAWAADEVIGVEFAGSPDCGRRPSPSRAAVHGDTAAQRQVRVGRPHAVTPQHDAKSESQQSETPPHPTHPDPSRRPRRTRRPSALVLRRRRRVEEVLRSPAASSDDEGGLPRLPARTQIESDGYPARRGRSVHPSILEDEFDEYLDVDETLGGATLFSADYFPRFLDHDTALVFCDTPSLDSALDSDAFQQLLSNLSSCFFFRFVILINASSIASSRGLELKRIFNAFVDFFNELKRGRGFSNGIDDRLKCVVPLITHCEGVRSKKLLVSLEKMMVSDHFIETRPLLTRMLSLLKDNAGSMMLNPDLDNSCEGLQVVKRMIEKVIPVADSKKLRSGPIESALLPDLISAIQDQANYVLTQLQNGGIIEKSVHTLIAFLHLCSGIDNDAILSVLSDIRNQFIVQITNAAVAAKEALHGKRFQVASSAMQDLVILEQRGQFLDSASSSFLTGQLNELKQLVQLQVESISDDHQSGISAHVSILKQIQDNLEIFL